MEGNLTPFFLHTYKYIHMQLYTYTCICTPVHIGKYFIASTQMLLMYFLKMYMSLTCTDNQLCFFKVITNPSYPINIQWIYKQIWNAKM